jgi:hypothetical protein
MWVVLLILILVVLSVLFGGFQKGTKTGSLSHSPAVTFTFSSAPVPLPPHQWHHRPNGFADRGSP